MKIFKKSFIIFIVFSIMLLINACNQPVVKKEIEFTTEESEIKLLIGETYKPKFNVVNLETYEFEYIYDNTIIDIKDDTITALSVGNCNVEVYIKDHKDVKPVKFNIIIENYKAEEVLPESLECEDEVRIYINDTYKLNINVKPDNASNKIKALSYNSEIATCDEDGIISGLGLGQTYILIKLADNLSLSKRILVIVEQPPVDRIESTSLVNLNYFETYKLSWNVFPQEADQEVTISSFDPNIASVDSDGLIIGNSYGTTTIRIQSVFDKSIYKDIEVNVSGDMTTDVIVPNNNISLQVGSSINLEYNVVPETAYPKLNIYTDDSEGLLIEDNLITAMKVGTYRVYLKTMDTTNIIKEITINVVGDEEPVFVTNDKFIEQSTLSWNEEFNPLDNIKAFDNIDGDITSKIVVKGEVDNRRYGEYMLEYAIKDSDGNEQKLTRKVVVSWGYDVMVIGHAGSYYGVPNSEEAILYAAEVLKYPAIEIDLKQTKDGVFVLSHDPNWGDAVLSETNYEDLKNVEYTVVKTGGLVGGHLSEEERTYTAKICTFERYLEICKQYNIIAVIELKTSAGVSNWTELNAPQQSKMPQIMELIKKYDMLDRVVFLSSQEQCLNWVKTHGYSYIPCQYLTLSSCENEKTYNIVKQYKLDISFNVRDGIKISDAWLAKYRALGCKLAVFTFEEYASYEDIQYWIDRGVDYVTTDWHELDKLELPSTEKE